MSVKAIVVGVSTYLDEHNNNLPFCKNDVIAVTNALSDGLAIKKENIIVLGKNGIVSKSEFATAMFGLQNSVSSEDTLIFYFSGHGGNIDSKHHYLCFSNGEKRTEEIINELNSIYAKNKIIILDSCNSGNIHVNGPSSFSSQINIANLLGKGYAVISSSGPSQSSYPYDLKKPTISLFTKFLCESLTDKMLINHGKKSLNDIKDLLFLYIDWWNNNPEHMQKQDPVFQSNIIGTVMFPVEQYVPYRKKHYYYESSNYTIYTVKPIHDSKTKRYAVQIILKKSYSLKEISLLNKKIISKVKNLNIFKNKEEERMWKNKPANLIFCYFGRDELDMINSNYLYHTIWTDNTQDKEYWYKTDINSQVFRNIKFVFNDFYLEVKKFQLCNTGTDKDIINNTEEVIRSLIRLAEKVIFDFNQFLSKAITEKELIQELKILSPEINNLYDEMGDIDFTSKKLSNWKNACVNLSSTIADLTLIYNTDGLNTRSFKNRIACMNDIKKRYYQNLEKLKDEERIISSIHNKKS